jgi:catechol 2,3-dioxygenase-like lactoylglutathione lyase family enzyme
MAARSLVWMGVRTQSFAETVALYRDVMGLPIIHEPSTAVWFRLDNGTELHVYAPDDEDHHFFGPGPVVGLEVDDFAATRARMIAAGIEFIGEPQREGGAIWNHFRGPDGNVYEIMERECIPQDDAKNATTCRAHGCAPTFLPNNGRAV